MSATAPAPLGAVAHYNLLERLEPAGPGDLFRARDTRLGRTVAIRLLPAAFAPAGPARDELIAGARALMSLSHPNITTVFDAGEHEDRVFVAFEFLKGQPLRGEMAGRTMNPRRVLEITIQIADAVAEAHAAGFSHRGLSPDSVTITAKGHAKIPTFHLASQVGFDAARGDSTLHDYESPEEARGEAAEDTSDVYSIGAVMYEMLTGRRPLHRGASAPSASNTRVPAHLDALVLKTLSPRPAARHQSAATLAAELRAMASALDAQAVGEDDEDGATAGSPRGTSMMLVVVVLLAALAAIVWWVIRS